MTYGLVAVEDIGWLTYGGADGGAIDVVVLIRYVV